LLDFLIIIFLCSLVFPVKGNQSLICYLEHLGDTKVLESQTPYGSM